MPLLKEELRNHVAQVFSTQLLHPVTIHFFTQESSLLGVPAYECLTCREARALLEEVASLSDKLTLRVHDFLADEEQVRHFGIDRMPALVLEGRNKGVLRYFGIPAGFEFAVVVEDLTDVSRGATQISDTARRQLAGLGAPVHQSVRDPHLSL